MPRPKGQVTAIAERYDKSPEFVRQVIKKYPDLGIKIEANKTILLDNNQVTALCAKIEEELAKYDLPELPITDDETPTNGKQNDVVLQAENEILKAENEKLKSELAEVKTDLAIAQTQAEEREKRIADLKEAQGENQKLLEAARDERDAAQEEAGSFRKSVFGFYRKKKEAYA